MSRSGASGRKAQSSRTPGTPLLPVGVNNRATQPSNLSKLTLEAQETIEIRTVSGTQMGEVIYNGLVAPDSVVRLALLSKAFQRILWHRCEVKIVPLNGSTTTAGYTAGFVEDPEAPVPLGKLELIQYLTTLRSSVVRQSWVAEATGRLVAPSDLPEMYTQLGSDLRRWSPGRIVIAAGGPITDGTFQLMLSYKVTLSVPVAMLDVTPGGVPSYSTSDATGQNNMRVGAGYWEAPQLPNGRVAFGATTRLRGDVVCVHTDSPWATQHFSIIPLGTLVTLTASSDANPKFLLDYPGRLSGNLFYITRLETDGGVASMQTVSVPSGLQTQSFRGWVNENQLPL